MFVPADVIWSSIDCWAPLPSATIVMTAATPMIRPSMVKPVRILFRPRALMPILRIMKSDMSGSYVGRLTRLMTRFNVYVRR